MKYLYTIGVLLVGLGGGVLVEQNSAYPYIGWWLLGIGILLVILAAINKPLKQIIAAPILNWEFTTNYHTFPEAVFSEGKRRVNWEGLDPQSDGHFYRLDMSKGRVITGVHFDHGSTNEVPKTWQMFFLDELGAYLSPYKSSRPPHISGQDTIIIERLEKPVKVRYIIVRITKPRMENGVPYKWRIESIYIREKRLCGLWNPIIGEL